MENSKDSSNVKVDIDAEPKPAKWKFMSDLPKALSLEEKKYLLAVERGDLANVRRMLQKAHRNKSFDINCVDSLGRGSLTLAIDGENLEMVELLVVMGVDTKDALLHSINVEFVEAVELLLEHEELIHKDGEPYSWQKVDRNTAQFTPDITPLILAAHRNNYEILTILLSRGATLPMPHDIKCGCEECIRDSKEDSLRHSLSRLNEYRALASPSLIALSSSDPILTSFQLSWELRNLAFAEPECKTEYMELRRQCQQFAVDLLHQSRSSHELAVILNHDPNSPKGYEEGEHMKLSRLELAIQYKQKKFVAHPNIQQLLAAIWYEGVPGFRRKTSTEKLFIIVRVAVLFPFYCCLYLLFPETKTGKLMRKPFMKFLIHASSYLFFLLILILVSQRAEDHILELFGTQSMKDAVLEKLQKQRGTTPAILEYVVVVYVMGFIMEETREIYTEGINNYLRNMWNFIDFTRNFLYCMVFLLRVVAYIQQSQEISADPSTAYIPRENWQAFDPQLIAEGLFAAANIFSALKLVHLFSINPHLGPLQISLGRMVIDIVKFFFIYSLVLFAFACGLNQLLWYFSNLEREKCYHLENEADWANQGEACMKWRRFANVFESSQSLFWASFGMVDLSSFELTGIKSYTRFWGLLMFGSYSVINVIVLLNLLIAMMSNSYAMIDEQSDTEWKFARTKLWMSYFEESSTLPPPFNIFPTPKMLFKLFGLRKKDKIRRMSTKRWSKVEKERDYKYTSVMRALVWRYVSAMHRKMEESEVTEDDINEVKGEISSFRYEMLEILGKNGMDISCADKKEKAVLGKRMKVWERRLMKDFKVAPVATEEEMDELIYEPPPENEDSLARFRRVAKLAVLNSSLHKWRQVITGACLASQIGHCNSRESFKKQQNLQKAMEEAKRLVSKSPRPGHNTVIAIDLPDITGSTILEVLRDEDEPTTSDYAKVCKEYLPVHMMKQPLNPNILIRRTSAKFPTILPKMIAEEIQNQIPKSPNPENEINKVMDATIKEKDLKCSSTSIDLMTHISPRVPTPDAAIVEPSSSAEINCDETSRTLAASPNLCKSPKNVKEMEKYIDNKFKSIKTQGVPHEIQSTVKSRTSEPETIGKSDTEKSTSPSPVLSGTKSGEKSPTPTLYSTSDLSHPPLEIPASILGSGRASPVQYLSRDTTLSPSASGKLTTVPTVSAKVTPLPKDSAKATPLSTSSRKITPSLPASSKIPPASTSSGKSTPLPSDVDKTTSLKSGKISPQSLNIETAGKITPQPDISRLTTPVQSIGGKLTPAPQASVSGRTSPDPSATGRISPVSSASGKPSSAPSTTGRTSPVPSVSGKVSPILHQFGKVTPDTLSSEKNKPLPDTSVKMEDALVEVRASTPVISTNIDDKDTSSISDDKKPKKYLAPRPPPTESYISSEKQFEKIKEEIPSKHPESSTSVESQNRPLHSLTPEITISKTEDKSPEKKIELEKSPLTMKNIRRVEDKPKRVQPKYGWL